MMDPPKELHEISRLEAVDALNASEGFLVMTFKKGSSPGLTDTGMVFSTGDLNVREVWPAISHHLGDLILSVGGWARESGHDNDHIEQDLLLGLMGIDFDVDDDEFEHTDDDA